jgi:AraC-like DNA-binding protein
MNSNTPAAAHVTEGRVRASPLRHLGAVLAGFGVPLRPVLDELGLPADLLDDPENTVEVPVAAQLLALAAEQAQCPHLGLLLGQRLSLETFGLIGALAQQQATVGTALRGLARTQHLHGRVGVPAFVVKDGIATYSLTLEGYLGVGAVHVHDLSAAMGVNMMRDLCGSEWAPTEIMLPHAAPADRRPYDRAFRAPIRFDAEWTGIAFSSHWLDHRIAGADPSTRGRLQEHVDAVAARHGNDLIMRTSRALYVLVVQGEGSMGHVADLVGMHRRTLNRRLAEHGTSISLLLEETKSHIARQLLSDTTMSMIQVSSTLGYSDASSFTRAFARWTKMTPTQWRDRRESRPPAAVELHGERAG